MADDEVSGASWRFLSLLSWLNELAFRAMGKIQDPAAGGIARNLELARAIIDWLDILEAKTAGNLTDDEARFLKQVLTTLRMNYVDEMKAEKPGEGGPAPEGGATA